MILKAYACTVEELKDFFSIPIRQIISHKNMDGNLEIIFIPFPFNSIQKKNSLLLNRVHFRFMIF
jgi:hypothetical protein